MGRPDITKPPVAPSGCDECLAPNGRHEWHCSEVPADLFIAALNAPRRQPMARTLRRQRPRIVAAVALALIPVAILTGAWWLGLAVFVLLALASARFVRRAK